MVRIVYCRKEFGVLRNSVRLRLMFCITCGDVVVNIERVVFLVVWFY